MLKYDEIGSVIPPGGGTKAASYVRERSNNLHTLSGQRGLIDHYALENGFEHVASYHDTGTGERGERPAL